MVAKLIFKGIIMLDIFTGSFFFYYKFNEID